MSLLQLMKNIKIVCNCNCVRACVCVCADEQSSDVIKGLSFNERSALNVKVMKNRRDACERCSF